MESDGPPKSGHVAGWDLVGVAGEIRRCLAQSPPDRHEALRWVAQFIAEVEKAPAANRAERVVREPGRTGDQRWDALLAATAEHVSYRADLRVPPWSAAPERFLERWWFVTPYRSLHASVIVATPAAFANRGVFIHGASLESV